MDLKIFCCLMANVTEVSYFRQLSRFIRQNNQMSQIHVINKINRVQHEKSKCIFPHKKTQKSSQHDNTETIKK